MSETTTPGYRATLAVPRSRSLLALGILSRLPSGLIPFAALISFTQHYGIGIAGLASGALLLAIALPGPARARWCATHGPAAPLIMALASVSLFAAAAAATSQSHWQIPLLIIAAAGALFPPLNPALRALWSRLMPDKQHLQSIHALDSTVEELTFVVTPLMGTAAMALVDARWVLAAGALLLVPAAVGLGAATRALPTAENTPAPSPGTTERRRSIIRSRDGQGITVPVIALGLCGGGLTVNHLRLLLRRFLTGRCRRRISLRAQEVGRLLANPVRSRHHWTRGRRLLTGRAVRIAPDHPGRLLRRTPAHADLRHRLPPRRRTHRRLTPRGSQRMARVRLQPCIRSRSSTRRPTPRPHRTSPRGRHTRRRSSPRSPRCLSPATPPHP